MCYHDAVIKPYEQKLIIVGVVLNKSGEILLTQRYDPELSDAHLKWDLPGGKREPGEALEDTCRREVVEETGYRVDVEGMIPYHFEYTWNSDRRVLDVVILGFLCNVTGGKPNLDDHKVNDLKWVAPSGIDQLETLVGTPEFIRAMIETKARPSS